MGKRGIGRLVGAVAMAVAVAVLWHGQGRGLGQTPRPTPAGSAGQTTAFRGVGSCSATACHGGMQPRVDKPSGRSKALLNEYTTWMTDDKHADAYQVLTEPRSAAITASLPGAKVPAYQDERCLACHATPVVSPASDRMTALVCDGVACESCHGPAADWLDAHTRRDWPGQSQRTEDRFGMVQTVNLVRRAQVCAGCHVGEPAHDGRPARDVNHDMIAAGHPRLRFEFSAYFANTSHHWRDDVGQDAAADFPAKSWAIGQVVTAKAALDLLQDRARRAGLDLDRGHAAPWPEFTEFGCFSCHHDLRDDPWRRQARFVSSPTPGRSRWGTWHFPMIDALAAADYSPEGKAVAEGLDALRKSMNGDHPDPAGIADRAKQVSALFGGWLDRLAGKAFDADAVGRLYTKISDLQARGKVKGWDEATQRYLALVPLSQSLKMLGPGPDRTRELTSLRDLLRYPEGYDSPKSFAPPPAASASAAP